MKKSIAFSVLFAMALGAGAARATTMVRLSLDQLSQASSAVVRGHVLSQASHWNAGHTEIVTDTTVAVEQAMKGSPGSTVVIRQLGGTVGNWHVRVPGSPRLLRDSSYVLFLEPAGSDASKYLVVGMLQGAYRVYRDARTGQERVVRPLGGRFAKSSPSGVGAAPDTVPMTEFRQNLAQVMSSPMVVPHGTALPAVIESASFRGVGRVELRGRLTVTLFPTEKTLIPVGSELDGTAELESGRWQIHWTRLVVRGTPVAIQAVNTEPGGSLAGRTVIARVR